MRKTLLEKTLSLVLVGALIVSVTGCSKKEEVSKSIETSEAPTATVTLLESTPLPEAITTVETSEIGADGSIQEASSEESSTIADEYGLSEQQRNSFSMLYHLAIIAEEIRTSKNNRLMLDDIYTALLNDINPGAIDETTQDHLRNLRDIIKAYLKISVKRERLQYIYNQQKAEAIRSAVPNPLAVLSVANALDWKRLVATVVYTVVDSYNTYKGAVAAADNEFLMNGWDLDDEETETIQKNRDRAFDYMVDIVQEYHLEGKMTLNEKSIETFAKICAIESIPEKLHRLTSEESTYGLLGNYWLELAECYFNTDQYQKCLECVDNYNALSTGIYRKDTNYVQILPMAIVSAQAVYSSDLDKYEQRIKKYADEIIENTTSEDWSTRYFAAQVYLDLFAKTNDRQYEAKAFDIAFDNVTVLLDEQRKLNATYLAEVKEVIAEEPDYRFMDADEKKEAEKEYGEEKKRAEAYTRELKKARETELLSLYNPLIVNCDLLFALADDLNVEESKKQEIEAVLQTSTNGIFSVKPINNQYSFAPVPIETNIKMFIDRIEIPADMLTTDASIKITVFANGQELTFDDCIISWVERKGTSIDTFITKVTSKMMSSYKWSLDARATITITYNDTNSVYFNFKVSKYSDNWILPDTVEFEEE